VVACVASLGEKDAESMVAALAPAIDYAVCTQLPAERLAAFGRSGATSIPATMLAELCSAAAVSAEAVVEPRAAIERARAVARERSGLTLCTGSHYLLSYVWTGRPAPSS
jgi:folylpolyglutamate synthase/dihydropteroate synthase